MSRIRIQTVQTIIIQPILTSKTPHFTHNSNPFTTQLLRQFSSPYIPIDALSGPYLELLDNWVNSLVHKEGSDSDGEQRESGPWACDRGSQDDAV